MRNKYFSSSKLFNKMNVPIKIMFILSLFAFLGCGNTYSKYYTDLTGGKNVLSDPNFLISSNKPKLIQGEDINDINNDIKRMLEDGYCLLGYSGFNSDENGRDEQGAINHAKKIRAEIVILYCNYTHTDTGWYGIPRSTYYCEMVRTVIPRYNYYATFWVKIAKTGAWPEHAVGMCLNYGLGVCFADLTDEYRKKIGSDKGVYIFAVIKDLPAFKGDLLAGDIIRKVDNIEIINMVQFDKILNEILQQKWGNEVNFEIFRDGQIINKRIKLE